MSTKQTQVNKAEASVSNLSAEQAKKAAMIARREEFKATAHAKRVEGTKQALMTLKQQKAEPTAVEIANAESAPVRECAAEVMNSRSSKRYVHIADVVPQRLTGQTDEAYARAVKTAIKPLQLAVWNTVADRLGIEPLKNGASDEAKKAYNSQKNSVMKAFNNASSLVTRLAKADVLEFALQEIKDTGANPRAVMEQVADYVKAETPELSAVDIADMGATVAYDQVCKAIAMLATIVNDKALTQLLKQAKASAAETNQD